MKVKAKTLLKVLWFPVYVLFFLIGWVCYRFFRNVVQNIGPMGKILFLYILLLIIIIAAISVLHDSLVNVKRDIENSAKKGD